MDLHERRSILDLLISRVYQQRVDLGGQDESQDRIYDYGLERLQEVRIRVFKKERLPVESMSLWRDQDGTPIPTPPAQESDAAGNGGDA